jgi:hypothetical protein
VFYFYRNGRLFTAEYYNQSDSLIYILRHEYDQDGNEVSITKLGPGKQGLLPMERTIRIFDKNQRLMQQKQYFGKKAGVLTTYQYNPNGYLKEETCKTKPPAILSYREEIRSYSYNAANSLIQMVVNGRDLMGKSYQYREEYSYDDKGRISAVKVFGPGNELTGTRVYQYLTGKDLGRYEERDSRGKTHVLFEYEDKEYYMEPGTQVSRYEGF